MPLCHSYLWAWGYYLLYEICEPYWAYEPCQWAGGQTLKLPAEHWERIIEIENSNLNSLFFLPRSRNTRAGALRRLRRPRHAQAQACRRGTSSWAAFRRRALLVRQATTRETCHSMQGPMASTDLGSSTSVERLGRINGQMVKGKGDDAVLLCLVTWSREEKVIKPRIGPTQGSMNRAVPQLVDPCWELTRSGSALGSRLLPAPLCSCALTPVARCSSAACIRRSPPRPPPTAHRFPPDHPDACGYCTVQTHHKRQWHGHQPIYHPQFSDPTPNCNPFTGVYCNFSLNLFHLNLTSIFWH